MLKVSETKSTNTNFTVITVYDDVTREKLFIIKGTEKTIMIGCGQLPEDLKTGIDYMVLNQFYPDMVKHIPQLYSLNPGMTVISTADMANFSGEFTRCGFRAHKVVAKSEFDIGGTKLVVSKLAGVSRSRHKDRSWSKGQKFPQIPNWQWQDSLFVAWPDEAAVFTGQLFGNYEGEDGLFKYFEEHQAPFPGYVTRILESIERYKPQKAYPSCGDSCSFLEGAEAYRNYIKQAEPEDDLILLLYASRFGYTKAMIEAFASGIEAFGKYRTVTMDVEAESEEAITLAAEKAAGIVAGTPTIEADAHPVMNRVWANFTHSVCKGKFAASIGNFSYSPRAAKIIMQRMSQLEMKVIEPAYSIRFKPDEEQLDALKEFGLHFADCMFNGNLCKFEQKPKEDEIPEVDSGKSFVIIGNGAAGIAAAEKLRSIDKGCSIEIIDRYPYNCYNRIAITKAICNDKLFSRMQLKKDEWYDERNIKRSFGLEVVSVDPEGKTVTCSDGSVRCYDSLIYAAGARQTMPAAEGIDSDNVFPLHTKEDVAGMRDYIENHEVNTILVVGGGILGLEVAAELSSRDKFNLIVADAAPILMPRHCNERAGAMVRKAAEKKGVKILTDARLTKVSDGKAHFASKAGEDTVVDADMIIVTAGLAPAPVPAGLEGLQKDGFIEINERAESPVENVYACGDCASFKNMNLGLWKQATGMAEVAALNALGIEAYYKTVTPDVSFTGFGLSFYSIGNLDKLAERKMEIREIYNPFSDEYEALYYDRGASFMGGVLVGKVDKAADLIEAWHAELDRR